MEKTKQSKGLIWVIIILIVLVVGLISFIVYKEFFVNNDIINSNETNDVIIETKKTMKLVENKDWVYDANYDPNVKQQVYTTVYDETYNVNDYKVPYVNINSEYAETINSEIKKLYDNMMQVFNNGIEDGVSYIDIFKYDYYLNGEILSIVLTAGVGATDGVYPDYYIFNIDINTGKKIDLENILNYKNLSNADFDIIAKNAIIDEYDTFYKNIDKSDNLYVEYYDEMKQQTLDDYNNSTDKKCYIDNNGDINLLATVSFPAGREYANKLIVVK